MTLADDNARLQAETSALTMRIAELEQQLAAALARIAELEHERRDPPSFAKPNTKQPNQPKQPRKKRDGQHNRGRRCETPTRIEQHALERCPDCNYLLQGNTIDYRRQVIELPAPQPVEIIEHQVIKRFCPHCQRYQTPKLDLHGQVLGQGRVGVRIACLLAFLFVMLRLPIRRIQNYLRLVHQLCLSTGQVVELLHQVRRSLQPQLDALKQEARASPILHADETGWREDGHNGYIWCVSTPGDDGVRLYEYDPSRGRHVVRRLLGGEFEGHLVSDFYASYKVYRGKHQRCWVHLLRDLHTLKQQHATDTTVVEWAQAVRALYDAAKDWLGAQQQATQEEREVYYVELTGRSRALGLRYAQAKKHACQALAKRLLRHEDELFQFVLIEGLSADNNLAERSIRPLVVIRKISGGSRSAEGTKTRLALASLFETWQARGLNPFEECYKLLSHTTASQTPLPQV